MTTSLELTDQERASLAAMPERDRRVVAAFRQAMADLNVPTHRGGQCAPESCPCSSMADAVTARAIELLEDPDAVPCMDCWIPLPLSATSYAVDGGGVCGPCGIRRYGDRAGEYLITSDAPDWDEANHVDPKSWTKKTITRHLYSHDRTFYFTSSDTKRELVEAHARFHSKS